MSDETDESEDLRRRPRGAGLDAEQREHLRKLLLEGRDSEPGQPVGAECLEELRARARAIDQESGDTG